MKNTAKEREANEERVRRKNEEMSRSDVEDRRKKKKEQKNPKIHHRIQTPRRTDTSRRDTERCFTSTGRVSIWRRPDQRGIWMYAENVDADIQNIGSLKHTQEDGTMKSTLIHAAHDETASLSRCVVQIAE